MNTAIGVKAKATRVFNPKGVRESFIPGEMGAILDWVVRDTRTGLIVPALNGKPNKGAKKSESFTRQFLDLLWTNFIGAKASTPRYIKDFNGTDYPIVTAANNFDCGCGIGDTWVGIAVGTGVTAPDISDYKIETLIGHGVGVGQFQYSAGTFGAPASDATQSQFTITRNFANASGGDITVNEVGLFVKMLSPRNNVSLDGSGTVFFCLTIHDVIAGGVLVANGETLTVNYRPVCVV
jgi:hypothetical protein